MPRLRLSARGLAAAVVGLVAADWAYRLAGDSFFPGGPLDEIAHLLTTLIVVWALGPRIWGFALPALVASVAIDVDHVPGQFGHDFLTRGTSRPYTHSLLSIAVLLVAAALWRSRRNVMLAIALGLAIHFWRDMSEAQTGVALLWPFSDHSFTLSHGGYVVVMALFTAAAAIHAVRRVAPASDAQLPF